MTTEHSESRLHDTEPRGIGHEISRSLALAVPVMIAFWVALVAAAVSRSHIGYAVPMAMGAAVGLLAGIFWGTWLAFVRYSRDEMLRGRASSVRTVHEDVDLTNDAEIDLAERSEPTSAGTSRR